MFIFPSGIPSGAGGYQPAGALFFDGSADYLKFTPSSTTGNKKFTFSCWLKKVTVSASGTIFSAWTNDTNRSAITIENTGFLDLLSDVSNTRHSDLHTTSKYLDPTAWFNLILVYDSTVSTPSGSSIFFMINGTKVVEGGYGELDAHDYPTQNQVTQWLTAGTEMVIGMNNYGNSPQIFYNGYMADAILLDGVASTDGSEFGELSKGIWVPKDPSDISSFGTNGFWLDFSNGSDIGNDVSGNNNDFTPTSMGADNCVVDGPANSTDKEITLSSVMTTAHQHMLDNGGGPTHHNIIHVGGKAQPYESYIYQSFQVSTTDPIYGVQFKMGSAGAGVISLRIETNNSGVPSGTLVAASAKKDSHSTSKNSLTGILELDSPFTPAADTLYWIKVSAVSGGDSTHGSSIGVDTSGTDKYTDGSARRDTEHGNTSATFSASGTDIYFEIYQNVTLTGTGNVATWNPLTLTGGALSEGNRKFSASGASQGCLATIAASSGKYFCEAVISRGDTVFFGVKPTIASLMTTDSVPSPWNQQQNLYFAYLSFDALGANLVQPETANVTSDQTTSGNYSLTSGDTVGCLLDLDDYDVRWYKLTNGAWVQLTHSTAAATTVDLYPANQAWTFAARGTTSGDIVDANFGQRPFSATPPDSAVALTTQNITSGYTGSLSNAIVTTNATEANIKSTTEGAHSFSNWISILYNRDASEQRIFYASDDSSNYIPFCDDGVLGKNSFPTLAGSNNWTGCAIATGSSTGIATGTISHSNGSDSSAAHGLTSPTGRFSILISSESTSSHDGWFWFHPDMTASNNMRLAQGGSEGQQSSKYYAAVTSSNAVVKSAAPTGTYRYIVFAENDLVSFYSYANVSGTDRINTNTRNKPEWMLWGDLSGGYGQYMAWSGTHNPHNPWTKCTRIHNISTNEITGSVDVLASGLKVREGSPGQGAWHQTDGQTTIGISIGTPFPLNNRVK